MSASPESRGSDVGPRDPKILELRGPAIRAPRVATLETEPAPRRPESGIWERPLLGHEKHGILNRSAGVIVRRDKFSQRGIFYEQ